MLAGAGLVSAAQPAKRERLPVAAIVTEYRRNSHADVIVGKILEGFNQDGGAGPALRLAALYTDQLPKGDLSRDLAKKHNFRIARTIEEAITLGGDKVAVAGVISIGEHGDYPYTKDTRQHMYPRRRFFDAIVETFRKCKRVVPVFSDKHLAYNWRDAKHMFDTARDMSIPFLAGSSLPVAWRAPALTLPQGCTLTGAIALGYGGMESYGFHALETLQCMVERRRGGETGVASVQAVTGDAIAAALKDRRWSRELLDAAAATTPMPAKGRPKELHKNATFFLIEYRDGLKAAVAMSTGLANQFAFAGEIKGDARPSATWFRLQEGRPYGHFEHLLRAIEETIHTGKPVYPVARTLLTTGALDALMHSAADRNRLIKTPELAVRYTPTDWAFARGVPAGEK
ncbi:MAG: hypothetical protein EXR98_06040 [Gemmataceae bacterium]|nr:hypothetical protein [Gemmataceae bacterium]